MNRRSFLQTAVCVPAGLFLTGNGLAQALGLLSPGNVVKLRCLGNIEGPRFLDGHTADGTVGLAPNTHPPYTGTRWQVMDGGQGAIALRCLGDIEGRRFLDGRTADGTVGLAPNTHPPYTGTRWEVF
jgi:ribosomal protein L31